MKNEIIPADLKSKSLKEAREEINEILEKFEKEGLNLEEYKSDYDHLLKLNKYIDELFKSKLKKINALGNNYVKKKTKIKR